MSKEVNEYKPMCRAAITGCGAYVPEGIITNDDLEKMIDTSDEWITARTGIKIRHKVGKDESTAMLATEAAKEALEMSKLAPEDVEMIIVATITPEMVFPSTASFVQRDLGATKAWVFDMAAACSGFVYSVSVAQQFIESGHCKNALIIGAETLTRITNWKDRTSCILFGDGAGAVVLEATKDTKKGILYSTMNSDGSYWEALNCQAYGSRYPSREKLEDPDKRFMQIKGREVYQQAVRRIVETVTDCLYHCNLTVGAIDVLVSHQMNSRIIKSAAKRLKLTDEQVFINIQDYGNTSAASVPLAFNDCYRQGKIKEGDLVVLVAFGAGLTWGANVVQF